MATGVRKDPFRNFSFILEIEGINQAGFSDVSGFGSATAPVEYQEGGFNTARKLPGQTSYPNITLKWGMTDNRDLYDWYRDITKGIVVRRDGSIVLNDQAGSEVARWNFRDAWPTKYDATDLSAKGTDVAIETLELVCEFLERD
jgi:phage tail-like protein